ncbi:MAG: DUF3520 domain-containing protein [Bacillota bacterium]|nr:DUF3520 domain-containing protein [Bacillota bacterium]
MTFFIIATLVSVFTGVLYPSEDALFISGVIEFALLLRDSEYKGNASRQAIIARLSELNSVENDEYKKEFLELVEKYNK